MNQIKYYIHGKSEVIEIKNINGQVLKHNTYIKGNCLVDILFDDIKISVEPDIKNRVRDLIYECNDYLSKDIQKIIKRTYSQIFNTPYVLKHELIEDEICSVLYTSDINVLLNYLILNIYKDKIMYKQCSNCGRYFGTRYQNAKYCDRIATKSCRTCKQVGSKKKNCVSCTKNTKEAFVYGT